MYFALGAHQLNHYKHKKMKIILNLKMYYILSYLL